MPSAPEAAFLSFSGLGKTFPNGTVALNDVSLDVARGTIHAICGENGAGKSTLMNILFGTEAASAGTITLGGASIATDGAGDGARHRVGMVHQHFSLVQALTVTENVILGDERARRGVIDLAAARERVAALAARYDLAVDPAAPVSRLPVAAQQKVEILKALSRDTQLLILDEPTAVLSPPEIDELFARLRALRDGGLTILLITHKLAEVRALAGHVTVLRGGRPVGGGPLSELDDARIATLAMGHAPKRATRAPCAHGPVCLTLDGVAIDAANPADRIETLTQSLRAGEILGVAGIDGSGQRGLVSLFGAAPPSRGTVTLGGVDMTLASRADWRAAGLAHLPADRFAEGGARSLTIAENAIAAPRSDSALQRGPLLMRRAVAARVDAMIARFSVRAGRRDEPLASLSGGNAQKLIAARELAGQPALLVADQPTRGIDAASAAFLHTRISAVARKGAAVLLISADLEELLALSDRIIVLFAGRVVADLANGPGLTPARLGPWMLGLEAAP